MSPTKNNLVKEGFTVEREYELSIEIMALEKRSGWTNIVHVTDGGYCCKKGRQFINFTEFPIE